MNTKLIVVIIFGILFIVSFVFVIVNASKLLGEGIKEVMNYDACSYSRPKMINPNSNITSESYPEEYYYINDRKRNISESLAYLIISLPIAIFFYKKLMKVKND